MADEAEDLLEALFESGRLNALLGWVVVGVFVLVLLESVYDRDIAWVLFTAAIIAIVIIPPLARRNPFVMLPWELLVLTSFPVVVRAAEVAALANTFGMYLSMAALALIVTVEVHVLSRVQVTHWFAIGFVILATLAVAGAWAIIRWWADFLFDTTLLTTNEALMYEFIWVVIAGVAAGVLFDLYFRRRAGQLRMKLMWVIWR